MSNLLKVGLLLCAVGVYFLFTWQQGENTGESFHRFRQDKGSYIKRADRPEQFEANQRNLRFYGMACTGGGALCFLAGFLFRRRKK